LYLVLLGIRQHSRVLQLSDVVFLVSTAMDVSIVTAAGLAESRVTSAGLAETWWQRNQQASEIL